MAQPDPRLSARPGRLGYIAAIIASVLGHAAIVILIFVLIPRLFHSEPPAPVAYTVKIVDAIPAGDLGSHLPPLASHHVHPEKHPEKPPPIHHHASPIIPPPEPDSKNELALNTIATPTETPTPEPTEEPEPTDTETATPVPVHHHHRATPTPTATPRPHHAKRVKAPPKEMIAEASPTPDLREELAKLHEKLAAEDSADESRIAADAVPKARPTPVAEAGSGDVVASTPNSGTGYGVGTGTGSLGIQADPDFVSYYQNVQQRIKKAWSFAAGDSDLTTQALFAIGPDGQLTGVKIVESSHDSAYDDSVMRAIRRAAPFPPPPEKYRSQFSQGIQVTFKLGQMQS